MLQDSIRRAENEYKHVTAPTNASYFDGQKGFLKPKQSTSNTKVWGQMVLKML